MLERSEKKEDRMLRLIERIVGKLHPKIRRESISGTNKKVTSNQSEEATLVKAPK